MRILRGIKVKIHSSFKDYYDHIGNMYGGGDPNIVYLRKPLVFDSSLPNLELRKSFYTTYTHFKDYDTAWLCVNAHYYLCLRLGGSMNNYSWTVFSEKNFPDTWESVKNYHARYNGSSIIETRDTTYYCGSYSEELLKASRILKAPVFFLYDGYHNPICEYIPKLGEMGFATVKTPEQMYQETAYFLGNLMYESPDLAKPSIMDDKQKIQSHGFDLKQSFRHRK